MINKRLIYDGDEHLFESVFFFKKHTNLSHFPPSRPLWLQPSARGKVTWWPTVKNSADYRRHDTTTVGKGHLSKTVREQMDLVIQCFQHKQVKQPKI